MPLVKFVSPQAAAAPKQTRRIAANTPPSPGPVLVPQTLPPTSFGAFSSAFSNAFDI